MLYKCLKDFYYADVRIMSIGDKIEINESGIKNLTTGTKVSGTELSIPAGHLYLISDEDLNDCDSGPEEDNVNHPKHYTQHPSGIECISITRHYCFSIGNAIKYLWRAGLKKDPSMGDRQKEIEDLRKAIWYINDRIAQLENGNIQDL